MLNPEAHTLQRVRLAPFGADLNFGAPITNLNQYALGFIVSVSDFGVRVSLQQRKDMVFI
jgi:hypothetical protein